MSTLPAASGLRKATPVYRGLLRYFPAALAGVARHSMYGNDKHCPGAQELVWDRSKSKDELDCLLRHLIDLGDGDYELDSGHPLVDVIAWRALALAQKWHEQHGAPIAPAAINTAGCDWPNCRCPVASRCPEAETK